MWGILLYLCEINETGEIFVSEMHPQSISNEWETKHLAGCPSSWKAGLCLEQSELLRTRIARAFVLVWRDRMAWRGCKALRISGEESRGHRVPPLLFAMHDPSSLGLTPLCPPAAAVPLRGAEAVERLPRAPCGGHSC